MPISKYLIQTKAVSSPVMHLLIYWNQMAFKSVWMVNLRSILLIGW